MSKLDDLRKKYGTTTASQGASASDTSTLDKLRQKYKQPTASYQHSLSPSVRQETGLQGAPTIETDQTPRYKQITNADIQARMAEEEKRRKEAIRQIESQQSLLGKQGGILDSGGIGLGELSAKKQELLKTTTTPEQVKKTLYAEQGRQMIKDNPMNEAGWMQFLANKLDPVTFQQYQTNPEYQKVVKAGYLTEIEQEKLVERTKAEIDARFPRLEDGPIKTSLQAIYDFALDTKGTLLTLGGLTGGNSYNARKIEMGRDVSTEDIVAGNQKAQETMQKGAEAFNQSSLNRAAITGDNVARGLLYDIVKVVPDMAVSVGLAIVTGGSGTAAKMGAKEIAKGLFTKEAREASLAAIGKALTVNPSTVPMGAKIFAQSYQSNLQEGMGEGQAFFTALVNAYGQSVLEGGGVQKALQEGGLNKAVDFLKSSLGEGFEEVKQNWWEGAVNKLVGGKDIPIYAQGKDEEAIFNPARDTYSAVVGAAAGGIGGAVRAPGAIKAYVDTKTKPKVEYENPLPKLEQYDGDVAKYEADLAEYEKKQNAPEIEPETKPLTYTEQVETARKMTPELLQQEIEFLEQASLDTEGMSDEEAWNHYNQLQEMASELTEDDIVAWVANKEAPQRIIDALGTKTAEVNPQMAKLQDVKVEEPVKPEPPKAPELGPKIDTSQMSPKVLSRMQGESGKVADQADNIMDMAGRDFTVAEIAKEIGSDVKAVRSYMLLNGIPVNPKSRMQWKVTNLVKGAVKENTEVRSFFKENPVLTTEEAQSKIDNIRVLKNTDTKAVPETELERGHLSIQRLGKSLGVDIVFYKGGPSTVEGLHSSADKKTLFINVDQGAYQQSTGRLTMKVVGHEFLHSVNTNQPELYKTLREVVGDTMTPEKVEKLLDRYKGDAEYQSRLENDRELLIEEMLADEAGSLFTDKAFWNNVYAKDATAAQKLVKILRDLINRILGKKEDSGNLGILTEMQIKEFQKKFEDAVADIMKGAEADTSVKKESVKQSTKKSYPVADRGDWWGDANYEANGGVLVDMSPDEFLKRAKPLKMDEDTRENVDELKDHIKKGGTLDPLVIYEDDITNVKASDGRHRAIAAKELGFKTVPVIDYTGRPKLSVRKDLVAIHNISEEKLQNAIRLGGFPVPSIAVTKDTIPFTNFGEISLVGKADLVDPAVTKSNKIFDTDIYSKRVPSLKRKVISKAIEPINKRFRDSYKEVGDYLYSIESSIENGEIDRAVSDIAHKLGTKMQYLKEKGIDIPIDKVLKLTYVEKDAAEKFLKGNPDFNNDAFYVDETKWRGKFEEMLREQYISKGIDADSANELINAKKGSDGILSYKDSENIKRDLLKVMDNDTEPDIRSAREAADIFIKRDEENYTNWLKDVLEPAFGEEYFSVWNNGREKKIPFDIDKVFSYMKGNIKASEGGFFSTGPKVAKARAAKEYKSLSALRKDAGLLSSEEETKAYYAEFDKRTDALQGKLVEYSPYRFIFDQFYEAMGDYLSGRPAVKALEEYEFKNVPPELVDEFVTVSRMLLNSPVNYFEAKPQRIVALNEFAAALVDTSVSDRTINALKREGLEVIPYGRDSENSWIEALEKTKDMDTRFSTRKDSSPYRYVLTNVRGGWTIEKIEKDLKRVTSSRRFKNSIAAYDTVEEFAENLYWHGTGGYIGEVLRPGSAIPKNAFRSGGYDEIYHTISLSKNKNVASNFTGDRSSGTVYPVVLRKDANVIERPDITDSVELEDILVELWEQGVDAVKLGDWSKEFSEQELAVLNPRAIAFDRKRGETFSVYKKKKFENPTIEELKPWYDDAKAVAEKLKYMDEVKYSTRKQAIEEAFKDSKVRNEDGSLKLVYHGTPNGGFTIFDKSKIGSTSFNKGLFGEGFYFTESEDVAKGYARKDGSIIPVYLNIKNPYPINSDTKLSDVEKLIGKEVNATNKQIFEPLTNIVNLIGRNASEFVQALKLNGFDGVIAENGYDGIEYVAFNPNQIKSPEGEFELDLENNDIRFSARKQAIDKAFKNSKVRDENGDLLPMYHGTGADFTVFDKSKGGSYSGAKSAKLGFFFTDSKEMADTYRSGKYDYTPVNEFLESLTDDQLRTVGKRLWDAEENKDGTLNRTATIEGVMQTLADAYGQHFDKAEGRDYFKEFIEEIEDQGFNEFNSEAWESVKTSFEKGYGVTMQLYLNITNPYEVKSEEYSYFDEAFYSDNIVKAKAAGHDGVIFRDVADAVVAMDAWDSPTGDVYVVFEPNQIKSPMGELEVDIENNDIRFSVKRQPTGKPSVQVILDEKKAPLDLPGKLKDLYRRVVDKNAPLSKTDVRAARLAANASLVSGTIEWIAERELVDTFGDTVGKSLKETVKPFADNKDFWEYMAQRHNINRAREGKPVDPDMTSDQSAAYVAQVEKQHPEYKEWADSVTAWIDQFMQEWAVKTGIIDADTYAEWRKMYPSYFPTYREFSELEGGGVYGPGKRFVDLPSPVKRATGSDRDITNPVGNTIQMMNKVVRTARYNDVGKAIYDSVAKNPAEMKKYAEEIPASVGLFHSKKLDNVVTVWVDGQPQYLQINDKMLLESLNGIPKVINNAMAVRRITNIYKGLITQYNPLFALRNMFRDIPTAYVYGSQDNPLFFLNNLAKAGWQVATKTGGAAKYMALGGGGSGQFSADSAAEYAKLLQPSATKNPLVRGAKGLLKGIEFINSLTELAPRVSEFNHVLEKTGNVDEALYAAQNVTVNFARGGDVTKQIEPFVPYLNASVQGFDRFFQAFNFKKDPAGALKRMVKAGIAVTAPQIASYILSMADDEEKYKLLDQRTKDSYYVFPKGDGTYWKIPKSREIGVLFASLVERALSKNFEGFGGLVADNFSPVNPFENNLAAPLVFNLPMNKDFAGRDIVPQYMMNDGRSPELQYDDNTSEIGKKLGELMNISPKQVDYIVRSYTGVIGQFLLPATTERSGAGNALRRMVIGAFETDPAFSSQAITDFYDKLDEYQQIKTDKNINEGIPSKVVTPEERMYNAMNKIASNVSSATKYINANLKADDPKVKKIREVVNTYTAKAAKATTVADLARLNAEFGAALYQAGVR